MSEVRNQVQNLTAADITALQLGTIGGRIFASKNAIKSQDDLLSLVKWWQAVHAPTFGLPIPGSGKTVTGDCSTSQLFAPATNETAYVTGLSFTNGSLTDPASVNVSVGNAVVWKGVIDPNGVDYCIGAAQLQPFFVVNGLAITVEVSGVSPDDVNFTLAYGLSVQG